MKEKRETSRLVMVHVDMSFICFGAFLMPKIKLLAPVTVPEVVVPISLYEVGFGFGKLEGQ